MEKWYQVITKCQSVSPASKTASVCHTLIIGKNTLIGCCVMTWPTKQQVFYTRNPSEAVKGDLGPGTGLP